MYFIKIKQMIVVIMTHFTLTMYKDNEYCFSWRRIHKRRETEYISIFEDHSIRFDLNALFIKVGVWGHSAY